MINMAAKLQRRTSSTICRSGGLKTQSPTCISGPRDRITWLAPVVLHDRLLCLVLDHRLTCICGPRPATHLYLWSSTINSLVSVVLDDHLWHAADESHAHLRRVVGAERRQRTIVGLGRKQVVELRFVVRTLHACA